MAQTVQAEVVGVGVMGTRWSWRSWMESCVSADDGGWWTWLRGWAEQGVDDGRRLAALLTR